MRYISLVLIVGFMWWTWALAHKTSTLSEQTHIGIQEDLQRLIAESIQANVPGASDVRFEKLWTEPLGASKLRVTMAYSYIEGGSEEGKSVRIGVEGFAILNKSTSENGEEEVWNMDEFNILNNKVEFQ